MSTSMVLAAQGFADPTRPPLNPSMELSHSSSTAGAAGADVLILQSVLLGPGRPSGAIISGKVVPMGGTVVDMQLVQVNEGSVVLKGPQGDTTLLLTPEAQKQVHVAPATNAASHPARSKTRKNQSESGNKSQGRERP